MEVLKDYPKEFAKLFRRSFGYLSKVNMKFLAKDEGFVRKYWRFGYIMPCVLMNYFTMMLSFAEAIAKGDIIEIAFLTPPFLVTTQAILKGIILIQNTPLLFNIIEGLGSQWRTTGLNKSQRYARDSLLKRVSFCNTMTYWISIIGSTQYLMTPLVETLVRQFVLKQECDRLLAVGGRFPFDVNDRWDVYLAVYGFQVFSMTLSIFVYVGAELLMITICALLGSEFILLSEDIINVKVSKKQSEINVVDKVCKTNKHELTMKNIVEKHQKLCVLSKQLDESFNQMAFVSLVFVGLIICFFRYAAQFSRGPSYTLNSCLAVMAQLLYVLYLCYYGELLKRASLRVGDMAYNSPWYKGDIQHQKTILLLIMRSQKPCCLTSMKYAPVTLNMFAKVMSSTWSYLSLMNTVYEEAY